MTVQLSVAEVGAIHDEALEIVAASRRVGDAMTKEPPDAGNTGLKPGFNTLNALIAAQKRYGEKADWCAKRWSYFAAAVNDAKQALQKVDEEGGAGIEHAVPFAFPQTPPAGTVGDY